MKKYKVRLVGGPGSGEEVWASGPTLELAVHPDFAVCDACADPLGNMPSMHRVRYVAHKFDFNSGHVHIYMAPEGVPPVSILNELWFYYKKWWNSQDNDHLQE